jgi:putative hydrolase of the HAD superfamily
MIKLIIFDLWQTLADRKVKKDWYEILPEKLNLKISKKDLIKIYENSMQRKKWESKYEAYSSFCKNLGLETTMKNVESIREIRDQAEKKTFVYDHVMPMLKKLKMRGYKIGLLSNTTNFAIDRLKDNTKLLDYIDYPIFSYEIGFIKPDLKMFKKVLGLANCKKEETIMIGDKEQNDVIPARRLGINAIHYKNYKQLKKDLTLFNIKI